MPAWALAIIGTSTMQLPKKIVSTACHQFIPPPTYQGRDRFTSVDENPFRVASAEPVSTFSIDVDTASYAWVRASLNRNVLPQPDAVRVEEMVNYFPYDYAAPRSAERPFTTSVDVFPSPWTEGRKLVRVGIRGYDVQSETRPRANLVFLIDTSGSMSGPGRLDLVKQSLAMLLEQLGPNDCVAIVTYAGGAGTASCPPAITRGASTASGCSAMSCARVSCPRTSHHPPKAHANAHTPMTARRPPAKRKPFGRLLPSIIRLVSIPCAHFGPAARNFAHSLSSAMSCQPLHPDSRVIALPCPLLPQLQSSE